MLVKQCSPLGFKLQNSVLIEVHTRGAVCLTWRKSAKRFRFFRSDASPGNRLRSITLNNLGLFYGVRHKLLPALKYLDQALRLELRLKSVEAPWSTHLNLCKVPQDTSRNSDHKTQNHNPCIRKHNFLHVESGSSCSSIHRFGDPVMSPASLFLCMICLCASDLNAEQSC